MKVKILKKNLIKVDVDIEFPHYFEDDFSDDRIESGLFGVINPDSHTIIHIRDYNSKGPTEVILTNKTHDLSQNYEISQYFDDNFKSSKDRYNRAVEIARKFSYKCFNEEAKS